MGKKLGDFLEKASETLDVPVDIIGGLPRAEIRGRHELILESHRGVREYGSECIIIDTPSGHIRVTGEELTIRSMNDEEIVVNGRIVALEYL